MTKKQTSDRGMSIRGINTLVSLKIKTKGETQSAPHNKRFIQSFPSVHTGFIERSKRAANVVSL